MPRIHRSKSNIRLALDVLLLFVFVSACTPGYTNLTGETPTSSIPTTSPQPLAEVVFEVKLPKATDTSAPVYLEILDEVTGLALNPIRYRMDSVSTGLYSIHLPFPLGSVVKYRYVLGMRPAVIEYTPSGSQVRYRLLPVNGPGLVQDFVAGWNNLRYSGDTGRIQGIVTDARTGKPVPDVLVSAGGMQVVTNADGSYLLEGLAPGMNQVVAYSLTGSHQTFAQVARVAAESTTPAPLKIIPSNWVDVTFIVDLPELPDKNAQVRLIGNTYALGNTFGDQRGGVNTLASRAPLLTPRSDGRYELKLSLPAGLDLRYKYSLGDGYWNAEHGGPDDAFIVRQLIVPDADTIVMDNVETFVSGNSAPITFRVQVPENTPDDELVSIQFNPYGWTEPIPMWRTGRHQWTFVLSSPLNMPGSVGYRYCRNDQCGLADDQATRGDQAKGFPFTASRVPQTFEDDITRWAYWQPTDQATNVAAETVKARNSDFVAGIEFDPAYRAAWLPYRDLALQNVRASGANLLVLTPTWTYTRQNLPVLAPVPGQDGLWNDWMQAAVLIEQAGIGLAVFPTTQFTSGQGQWWQTANRDANWWHSWFDRYETFLLHHADYASRVHAQVLIIGGPDVTPAYPDGALPDGSPSGVPADAAIRWRSIISNLRTRYSGTIALAVDYTGLPPSPPPFISDFDQLYVLWSAPLAEHNGVSFKDLAVEFGHRLDEDILPLVESTRKPAVLALNYPSIEGAARGCPFQKNCQTSAGMAGTDKNAGPPVSMQEQVDLYNAAFIAVNSRDWVAGVISRGYYPPAVLQDRTASVHGKPAWDVLWYWFPRLLGHSQS